MISFSVFCKFKANILKPKRIVLTGAPGTGKTSLINSLEARGYSCLPEVSREVILLAKEQGRDQPFLDSPLQFSELLLEGRIKQFYQALGSDRNFIFYDRGIHDVVAYLDYAGEQYPKEFDAVCKIYSYDMVFLLPPWQEIYLQDNERYENFEEALNIHESLVKTYHSYDFESIEVPKVSIEERVEFILKKVSSSI